MKSSKHNNPESWRDDVNLRRALQQRNSNLPLLPEDFADRVMAQLDAPAPHRRRLWPWVAATLSTAALVALVFLLNSPERAPRLAEAEKVAPQSYEESADDSAVSNAIADTVPVAAAISTAKPLLAQSTSPTLVQTTTPSEAIAEEPAVSAFLADAPVPTDSTATPTTPSSATTEDTPVLSPVDLDHLDHLIANAAKNDYYIKIKEERVAREETTKQQTPKVALALNLGMSGSDRSSSDINNLTAQGGLSYGSNSKSASYYLPAGNGYTYDFSNQAAVRKAMMMENSTQYKSDKSVDERYYGMPITVGVNIRWNMTQHWALESGLNYTYLSSSSKLGTTYSFRHKHQQIHYLGIPLRGLWQFFQRRHWGIYAAAGGGVEFPVSATLTTSNYSIENPTTQETSTFSAPIQFSMDIGLGVQYSLSRHLGFFAEPRLQWHIPTGSDFETYYTRHPLHFNPTLGLRLTI